MVACSELPNGLKVLVVEDEYLIASDLCRELSARGVAPIGPFGCIGQALREIESARTVDAAILDINIGGRSVYALADRLVASGSPFVFGTGYDECTVPRRFLAIQRIEKPLDPDLVVANLSALYKSHSAKSARKIAAAGSS